MICRKMKDSETTWLADIPSDWEITRIASLYSLENQKG